MIYNKPLIFLSISEWYSGNTKTIPKKAETKNPAAKLSGQGFQDF